MGGEFRIGPLLPEDQQNRFPERTNENQLDKETLHKTQQIGEISDNMTDMTKTDMETEDDIKVLEERVVSLCARCDALAREVRRLGAENRKMREKSERAKEKVREIIARIPGDGQGLLN